MRRVALAVAAAMGVLCCSVSASGRHEPVPPWSRSPAAVQVLHLADPGTGLDRQVWVYRPPVPDSATLPVLYFLHGFPGRPRDVFERSGLLDALAAALPGGGRPLVVAAVEGSGSRHPDTEWADAVAGGERVETFLTRVAIPAVEGARVRDRAHRAVAGFSMGGYGAANLALRHPDLFGQFTSFAGYFHVDDPDGMFAGRPDIVHANSPDLHLAAAHRLRILLVDGDRDDDGLTAGETPRYGRLLAGSGAAVTVLAVAGEGHDWGLVRGQVSRMLRFLAAGWGAG